MLIQDINGNINKNLKLLLISSTDHKLELFFEKLNSNNIEFDILICDDRDRLKDNLNDFNIDLIFYLDYKNNKILLEEFIENLKNRKSYNPVIYISEKISYSQVSNLINSGFNEVFEATEDGATLFINKLQSILIKKSEFQKNGFINNNFSQILDLAPDLIYVYNASDYKFLYVNKSVEELSGYSSIEQIGKTPRELFSENYAKSIEESNRSIIETGKTFETREHVILTKSGDSKICSTVKIPVFDSDGKASYIVGYSHDLSQERRTESELFEAKVRFTQLFHSSPVPIIFINQKDLIITNANDCWYELSGSTANEIIGMKISDLSYFLDKSLLENYIEIATNHGTVTSKEIKIKNKFGDTLTLLLSIEYIETEISDPWLILMVLDITDRIATEEENQKNLQTERELNYLKSRFISTLSHEYRTPLTTIMLSTDILRRCSKDWDEIERNKHFDRIQETVLKMTQLMEKVLTIGRIDSGRFEFNPENIDVPAFCTQQVESFEFSTANKNKIHLTLNGNFNNLQVDETLLGLIVSNLLSNAIKYSGESTSVYFDITCYNNILNLQIRDEGLGIPKEDLEHLFSTFFRASNVGHIEGYGLGLSIVKRCVDSHNGTITVESEVGFGTTFKVCLPV